ncbi:MAG: universal stress protein [Bacteroidota bacterium]
MITEVTHLQEFFKATLHLLHINTPSNFTDDALMTSRMEHFASHFSLSNYTTNIYNSPDVEQGIHMFATRIKAGLIAIGTHGHGRLVHLIHGGLAQEMANHSDMMIWTYASDNVLVEHQA